MAYAPENTRPSFELGWRLGADALECDVRLSKDGKLVIIHDDSLDRTTTGAGLVSDTLWARLRDLDAGGWFHRRFKGVRLWRLEGLMRWMEDKRAPSGKPLILVLEIKNDSVRYESIAEAVVKALRAADFVDRTLAISFDHGVVKRAKELCPSLRTGILFARPLPNLNALMEWTGADTLFPKHTLIKPLFSRIVRQRRWFLGTWTVNGLSEMKRLIRLGVDGIATNCPEKLIALR